MPTRACTVCKRGTITPAGAGGRCAQCGARYRYRTRWLALLATIVIAGLALAAILGFLVQSGAAKAAILFGWVVLVAVLFRVFRALEPTPTGDQA
jgi:hypothetical protein